MRDPYSGRRQWRDDDERYDRYAWCAGEPGPGPNRHRLRRDMRRGKVAGVCAGLADYLEIRVKWIRLAFILGTIFVFPAPIIVYGVAAVLMKPGREYAPSAESFEEERFWRDFNARPQATFSELKHRFRALDARVAEMEGAVTSDEYALRKEFRDLERGAN